MRKQAKILEIGPYPPPRAGWGVRIELVKKKLLEMGYECVALNTGTNRKIKSKEYECVQNGLDYLRKIIKYSRKGYVVHAHINGDTPKGFILTLSAEFINLLFGKRCFLTFHAGVNQIYFPRENNRLLVPMFRIMFSIPKVIICNSQPVKEKIMEYGIDGRKIIPIPAFSKQYLEYKEASLPKDMEIFLSEHEPVLFTYIRLREGFYIDTMLKAIKKLIDNRPKLGLVITGVVQEEEHIETQMLTLIESLGLKNHLLIIDDLSHDAFLTVMKKSTLYLRTPTTDGVASSVLEALYLNIPVVASENGTRPDGVITYHADDEHDMVDKVEYVLNNYHRVKENIHHPEIRDTLSEEAQLLISY